MRLAQEERAAVLGICESRPWRPSLVRRAWWRLRGLWAKLPLFPVLCSWCLDAGVRTVVKRVGFRHSHGICARCAAALDDWPKYPEGRG